MKFQAWKKIILLCDDPAWAAAARRQAAKVRVADALDFSDLLAEASSQIGSLGVIKVTHSSLEQRCRQVAALSENPFQLRMVALAEPGLEPFNSLLSASGFVATIGSLARMERLNELIDRHFESVRLPQITLEEKFQAELPW